MRQQQPCARQRRRRGQRQRHVGVAEERVRQRLVQRRAERQVLRVQLVDVDADVVGAAQGEIVAACTNVAHRPRPRVPKLALEVDRELLDARRGAVLIDEPDVAVQIRERAQGVARRLGDPGRERVAERGRIAPAARQDRVLRVAHLAVVVGRGARDRKVHRRPIHTVATADDRLRVERVDNANAWGPLHCRRVALISLVAVDAGVHQATDHGSGRCSSYGVGRDGDRRQRGGHARIPADREVVVLLRQPFLVLETQAVVHRELRADAPVVLDEATEVVCEEVERGRYRQPALTRRQRRRIAQQERRERIAVGRAAGAAIGRRHVLVEVEIPCAVSGNVGVHGNVAPVAAEP